MMPDFYSLSDFQAKVKMTIVGQDKAVDALTTILFRHLLRVKQREYYGFDLPGGFNIMLKGSTGTGKSCMIRTAASLCGMPVAFINAAGITADGGWAGNNLAQHISASLTREQLDMQPIIVIDEFDKILSVTGKTGTAHSHLLLVQQSILPYVAGVQVARVAGGAHSQETLPMDTSQFLFIFAGAFSGIEDLDSSKNKIGFLESKGTNHEANLYDKLIEFGCIPELAGRINNIIELNDLTKDDLINIANNSEAGHTQWLNYFNSMGMPGGLNDIELLAERALAKKLGARGLLQEIESEINVLIQRNERLLTLYHVLGNTGDPNDDPNGGGEQDTTTGPEEEL